MILDMATSKVALGKVRVNFNKGVPMAEGSLIDGEGAPTNDPAVMFGATGTDGTVSDTPDPTRPRVSRRVLLSWSLVVDSCRGVFFPQVVLSLLIHTCLSRPRVNARPCPHSYPQAVLSTGGAAHGGAAAVW